MGRPGSLRGIQLEHDAADLYVISRLEALRLQRADDPHAVQAALDVGERVEVLHVVAGDEAVDALPRDAPQALLDLLDLELLAAPAAGGRPEDAVLLERLVGAEAGRQLVGLELRHASEQLGLELVQPQTRARQVAIPAR